MNMSATSTSKQEKTPRVGKRKGRPMVCLRIDPGLYQQIMTWSRARHLDLSYAVRRSIEIGWPTFQERNFDGLDVTK
jgi:hypothetical protein